MDKSNKNLRTLQYTYTSVATKFNVSSSYRLWNLRVHTDAHIDINTTSGPVGSNRTSSAFCTQCFNFLIHGLKTIRNYSKTENLTRNTTNVNHLKFYLAFFPKEIRPIYHISTCFSTKLFSLSVSPVCNLQQIIRTIATWEMGHHYLLFLMHFRFQLKS